MKSKTASFLIYALCFGTLAVMLYQLLLLIFIDGINAESVKLFALLVVVLSVLGVIGGTAGAVAGRILGWKKNTPGAGT